MESRTHIIPLLLAAAVLIAVMAGYHFWRTREDVKVGSLLVSRHGVVTAIVYNEEKPSAVIDSKLVHIGDVIDGVKVVGIYRDRVEFDKNGTKWAQKIQGRPANDWK
jgi:hypothetical protein